jgi:hypothetical protein
MLTYPSAGVEFLKTGAMNIIPMECNALELGTDVSEEYVASMIKV